MDLKQDMFLVMMQIVTVHKWYTDAQSIKSMFDKDFKHDASKLIFARMDPPWVTKGRSRGNNSRGRGRSSPGSSLGFSYGSSSNFSILERRGMSLINLPSKSSQKASSSVHLEDIPEGSPLYAELQAYLSQK
ncbi:hypothetical protein H5410_049065 [Solanum commersonii]|uniref:Uncharacterized protein n=1 Tax=Solanum commersonii TaxID=4109 RepID=A0A9J5XMD8_SOLCO|nr:hypothetical protein H5410_049065 [Solanum commersonii]